MKRLPFVFAALLAATTAYAHGPSKGTNGGQLVDAGDYHVEMVAKDMSLSVYINDDQDKPIDAKGFKATGIFVVGGKAQRVELVPQSANKLSGTSQAALPANPKGVVQITLPNGKTVQAKFD